MLYWLVSDPLTVLCGGEFDKYLISLEGFLQKLSDVAELVFFEDGPVRDEKKDTWIERQNSKYLNTCIIIDQINNDVPLSKIVENMREVPSILACLPLIETTVKKFGSLIVTVTKECDAELVQYSNKNPLVLAIIADDSDFLIFSGSWRYFSLRECNIESLVSFEFNRKAFWNYVELNESQLKIFATLGGNDIMKYEDLSNFHFKNIGKADERFKLIAKYVKEKFNKTGQTLIDQIASKVFQNSGTRVKQQIQLSMAQYETDFEVSDFSEDPLLAYCRQNDMDFTFEILEQIPRKFSFSYFDFRCKDFPNINDVFLELLRKQTGILLKHRKPYKLNQFKVLLRKTHGESFQTITDSPQYPKVEIPPLLELFNRENFPEHDEIRFKLLKWMIDEQKLKDCDLRVIPKNYLLDIMTLTCLTTYGFITTSQADLILLTIYRVQTKKMPERLRPPSVLNKHAFKISFIFVEMHTTINRCLQILGLKKSMTVRLRRKFEDLCQITFLCFI